MISDIYRYKLESRRVTGLRQQKINCPKCGRRKCFVRYVDTYNEFHYLSNEVGRCDHELSCGYHYRPADFFHDHPWTTEKEIHYQPQLHRLSPPQRPLQPLPMELVERSHSPLSNFWQWFITECSQQLNIDDTMQQRIFDDYLVGATRHGEVIFWQIDEQHRLRSGHIMNYTLDGHRKGYQGWIHSRLINKGLLPEDFQLYQCFYGQHLLTKYKKAHVCLVESEKTALIMAACYPNYLWLATCGSCGLNSEKLECLRSRCFTLFPDSGCLLKWRTIMLQTKGFQYTISEQLEKYPANTDIADLLLRSP